jgi:hypothetical protein
MLRVTVKLAVAALVAHAAFRVVPPFWNYFQFRDAVSEAAMYADTPSFSGHRQTPDQILDKLAIKAKELNVPLDREDFQLRMDRDATVIDARYKMRLEYLPRVYAPYEFVIHAEGEPPSKYRNPASR